MIRSSNRILLWLALWPVVLTAHPQDSLPGEYEHVLLRESTLSASKLARQMAAGGDWIGSIDALKDAIDDMAVADPSTAAYRSYLYFNMGYLYEQRPDADTVSLQMSQQSYVQALHYKPNDIKILNNLILVSRALRDHESALAYIDQIVRLDSASAYEWHLVAGDIYRTENKPEQAWVAYKRAVALNPTNRGAAQKIVDLYDEMKPVGSQQLLAQCKEFRQYGMAEMARIGLEEIIRKNCASGSVYMSESPYMEDTLLEWMGVQIENGWVRPSLLNTITEMKCTMTALEDLELGMREGWKQVPPNSWWLTSGRRHFYYLATQKSWADYLFSTGRLRESMELYETVWRPLVTMNDISEEIYGREGVILTDLMTQLVRLYADKTLDPNGSKFRELEERLFQRKGGAIASGDLAGMQKFHTILGYIYIERREWDSGPTGARYQLEHAIRAANRASQRDPTLYKPIPHLYYYLGIACINSRRTDQATEAFLDAAIDYLETDNLGLAEQMIKKVDSLSPGRHVTRARVLSAKAVLEARTQIKRLGKEAFTGDSGDYFRGQSGYKWLDNSSGLDGIPEDVLKRQRFKTLSDLSEQAESVGATSVSRELKEQAQVSLAGIRILSSQQDIIRLKRISNSGELTAYKKVGQQVDPQARPGEEIFAPNQQHEIKRVIDVRQR